jgi:hypothetical protein
MKEMRKALCALTCLIIVLGPGVLIGGEKAVRFSDVQSDLDSEIAKLSAHINMFEYVLNKMDVSARANQNYDEQKNIFLSSQLAITTITAILEYNRDLLVLFGDLKEKNRNKYYQVRIESLETSINQINNMHNQIQINYKILSPDFFGQVLVNTERKAIMSAIASMEACCELLKSVNRK